MVRIFFWFSTSYLLKFDLNRTNSRWNKTEDFIRLNSSENDLKFKKKKNLNTLSKTIGTITNKKFIILDLHYKVLKNEKMLNNQKNIRKCINKLHPFICTNQTDYNLNIKILLSIFFFKIFKRRAKNDALRSSFLLKNK